MLVNVLGRFENPNNFYEIDDLLISLKTEQNVHRNM